MLLPCRRIQSRAITRTFQERVLLRACAFAAASRIKRHPSLAESPSLISVSQ